MTLISIPLHFNSNSYTKIWSWFGNDGRPTHDFARLFFTLVGVFVIFRYVFMCIKSKKAKPRSPPGPRGLPLVGSLPFLEPDLHSYFAKLARTYGPVLKLQLGNKTGIVVSSPSTVREVLKDQDITFANRDAPVVGLLATGGHDIVWSP
ncbi:hypothetical protein HRI_000964400 [Hibiscus trionum]|uniref:Cytochrome P450 n=1 Tax=Hibiscus trionum TaxID=183268 RepID=A0A9W7LR51_HIBTR|nr:hypothetical protein HRI_000964400 [Hibiscus trionum]